MSITNLLLLLILITLGVILLIFISIILLFLIAYFKNKKTLEQNDKEDDFYISMYNLEKWKEDLTI